MYDAIWAWAAANLEGPIPPDHFVDDGCTCAPDQTLVGKRWIRPACRIHDFHYSGLHGCEEMTREKADAIFRRNIYKILRHQHINPIKAYFYSFIYWRAVVKLGRRFYKPLQGVWMPGTLGG
jgi:hypothetical protein